MARKRDLQSLVAKFQMLASAAEAHQGELPTLARFKVALQAILEEIAAAKKWQSNLEALRREATQNLWSHVAAGQDTSARLTSLIRALFGRQPKWLEAFGIKLGGRRLKPGETKKGGTTPPDTPKRRA
jgi:hypothetical protein